MNWLFRRHFWILHLVFLCMAAVIFANIVTTVLGYWLSKSIPEKPISLVQEGFLDKPAIKDFSFANERNLFDAKREQIVFTEIEEEDLVGDPGRWQDAGPSSLPLKLMSTLVAVDPYRSIATISINSVTGQEFSLLECNKFLKTHDPALETYLGPESWEPARPCSDIGGMATLLRIEEYRVYIFNERERRYEYLSLLADDMAPKPVPKVKKTEISEGKGIRKVGANSFEIDQNEFDKALSNVARLMTEARAVPSMDDQGNYVGFKIVYLKSGSLFEKIGIERMDVLTRINGYELNSPEKALQLFGRLRTANQFTIDLKRGGSSLTLDYTVVR